MSRDEYYLMVYDAARYSWKCLSYKYRIIILINNLDEDDVVHDVLVKLLKPKKDGSTYYDSLPDAGVNMGSMIRSFVYRVMTAYLIDKGRVHGDEINAPGRYNVYDYIEALDDFHVPEPLQYHDIYDLEIKEILHRCEQIKVKGKPISRVVERILEGETLAKACRDCGITKQAFLKKINEVNIKDYIRGDCRNW